MKPIKFFLCTLLLLSVTVSAATYVVKPDGSGDYPTIQAAIDAATTSDIIELTNGTFTGGGNRNISYGGKAITVRSQSGNPENCIIDCEGLSSGFWFQDNEEQTSVLEGVKIIYGSGSSGVGGAVRCGKQGMWPLYPDAYGSPTIRNCIFTENSADRGGGVGCTHGSQPILTNCAFLGNSASSPFMGDRYGGGMYCHESDATLINCTFRDNICSTGSGQATGGGIFCDSSDVVLDSCVFSGNSGQVGGGIAGDGSRLTISYCTVNGNSAGAGGGIYLRFGTPFPSAITNCTIYGNSAASGGGLACVYYHSVTVDNTIIAMGTQGEAVYRLINGTVTMTCCDVYGNAGGPGDVVGQIGTNGNIALYPGFCSPRNDDFTLRSESPCAPFSPPNPECDLIGAWPVACSGPLTYLVCPTPPADFSTIQAAIDAVLDGDTIELCNATFTGDGNRDLDYGGKAIVIRSESGDPEACVIDCQGTPSQPHRGIHFHSGEGAGSVLQGITITNGYAVAPGPGGAAVLVEGSSPTITGCILSENTSESFGGGMQSDALSYPEVTECVFSDNTAWDDGGGLASFSGVTVEGCEFTGNASTGGHGGGMTSMPNSEAPEIIGCTFSNNSAYLEGGGLSAYQFAGTVSFCTFSSNSASWGGGFYCGNSSDAALGNCTLYDNSANNGGGIAVDWNSSADIDNTIIAFSPQGTAVYCDATSGATLSCCDVFSNSGGAGAVQPQIGSNGNLAVDPIFCDTAAGDLRIDFASPCAPANNSCGVLIGAHEAGCDEYICGDADGNGIVNISDGVYLICYIFSTCNPPDPLSAGDVNCNGMVNVSDAVYLICYVFAGGPPPCADCPKGGGSGKRSAITGRSSPYSAVVGVISRFDESADSRVVEVTVRSATPIAGVQLEFDVNLDAVGEIIARKTARSAPLQLLTRVRGGRLRIGLIDISGFYTIPAGEEPIIILELERGNPDDIQLVDVVLADANARELTVSIEQPRRPSGLPTEFTLAQNHPNPFNPITEIEYSLPQPAQVRLEVYNLLGQKIKTLIDKWQSAGRHQVRWVGVDDNNRAVASGVYLYRMTAGDYTDCKKMLLVK